MTKKIISVVGNCQAGPIASRLLAISNDLELLKIPPVHTIQTKDRAKTMEVLAGSDIIIHQPLGPKFGELASASLRQSFPTKDFISFPSIHFAGTLPQLKYLRIPEGGTIKGPLGDYHDSRLLRGYLDGRHPLNVQKWIMEYSIDAQNHFDQCITESENREKKLNVGVVDVILDSFKTRQTMNTFNHPDNEILCVVAARILSKIRQCSILSAPIPNRPWLGRIMAAIPETVTQQLRLKFIAADYLIGGIPQNLSFLATVFFKIYDETENFLDIIKFNEERNS